MRLHLSKENGPKSLLAIHHSKLKTQHSKWVFASPLTLLALPLIALAAPALLTVVDVQELMQTGAYSHPYYWASFIFSGNWRSLEELE